MIMNTLPKRNTPCAASKNECNAGGLYVSPFDEDLFQLPIDESSNAIALIDDGEDG
jgi:hypothetical protein